MKLASGCQRWRTGGGGRHLLPRFFAGQAAAIWWYGVVVPTGPARHSVRRQPKPLYHLDWRKLWVAGQVPVTAWLDAR
jgi:hypothetical protein